MSEVEGGEDLEVPRKPRGIRLPAVFGCLVFPLMLLAIPISIPWGLVDNWLQRRRERAFREDLRARGRLMSWEDVHRAMDENRGTLLEEWYSFKGPVRYWWTAENVREVSPHPVGDWTRSSGENF